MKLKLIYGENYKSLRQNSATKLIQLPVFVLQKIPKWWNWCYWICPGSWSLRGLLTSQYGDIDKEIVAFGERKAIKTFLGSYFGYHSADTSVVALVLIAFPFVFASIFAYSMAKLNFQRR